MMVWLWWRGIEEGGLGGGGCIGFGLLRFYFIFLIHLSVTEWRDQILHKCYVDVDSDIAAITGYITIDLNVLLYPHPPQTLFRACRYIHSPGLPISTIKIRFHLRLTSLFHRLLCFKRTHTAVLVNIVVTSSGFVLRTAGRRDILIVVGVEVGVGVAHG
jgi:hypothetical protein